MDDTLAVAQIKALVAIPGALRIITNVRSETKRPKDVSEEDWLKRPEAWVIHNVTAIEGPDKDGYFTARSVEGDWAYGKPAALLARLQESHR